MIEISHSCRTFLNNKGQVVIRVRWNNRDGEVGFSVGCNADPDKWDKENQRAKYNTTHKVGGKTVVARDINQSCFSISRVHQGVFHRVQFKFSVANPKVN